LCIELPEHLEVIALLPMGYLFGERNKGIKRKSMGDKDQLSVNYNKIPSATNKIVTDGIFDSW